MEQTTADLEVRKSSLATFPKGLEEHAAKMSSNITLKASKKRKYKEEFVNGGERQRMVVLRQ
jgi:hypothetical protein